MNKRLFKCILCIGIIVIILACVMRFVFMKNEGETKIEISSLLTDAIDISELSTGEFSYRGIAEIYKDENSSQPACRVCYNAVVKAGIDVQQIELKVDNEKKTVMPVLPEINLKVTIVDEQSMALLPSDADVDIDLMLKYSREDAEREARESTELLSAATDNLRSYIEGLLYPVLKTMDYQLIWE